MAEIISTRKRKAVTHPPGPDTPTQAGTSRRRRPAIVSPAAWNIMDFPDEILEQALVKHAGARELCALALTSARLRALSDVRLGRRGRWRRG